MPFGLVNRRREYELTRQSIAGLAVKSPHLEVPVNALSGGSQQKVLLARGRLGDPKVVLVEDPTQGVDAGARVEIYAFLRAMADSGVAVVVLSTDAVELEGLCDRVVVFSRGHVQASLVGDEVDERAITGAAVLSSETASVNVPASVRKRRGRSLLAGEGQAVILLGLAVALSIVTSFVSSAFLSPLSISQLLAASAVLILVGLAQLVVVITGGIDLSIGSVVALSAVIVSFFGQQGIGFFAVGAIVALAAGAVVGLVNGLLITRLGLPPVIATLVTSIAVLGIAQVLRPFPGGSAGAELLTRSGWPWPASRWCSPSRSWSLVLWAIIQRTSIGRGLRAAGSDPVKANRMGVRVPRTRLYAAITAGVLASMAGLVVYSRSGIGDANAAQALTLTSVTAVVIAGASIFGGSGSALAVAAAGILLQTVTSSLSFLSVGLSWQYWIQGAFVLFAAIIPVAIALIRKDRAKLGTVRSG